jgi:hypothetical protein
MSSSYTRWDRHPYIERVGGEEEAKRRSEALIRRAQAGDAASEEETADQARDVGAGRIERPSSRL